MQIGKTHLPLQACLITESSEANVAPVILGILGFWE